LEWALLFLLSFFLLLAGAGLLLHWVVAAPSIPQGVRGSNHSHGCLVVSGTNRFSHERLQSNKKHCEKKIIVWADTLRKMLLMLPHEDTRLEALHLHDESEQLKIGLSFALPNCPSQTSFKRLKS
jgi:hypothetical protein